MQWRVRCDMAVGLSLLSGTFFIIVRTRLSISSIQTGRIITSTIITSVIISHSDWVASIKYPLCAVDIDIPDKRYSQG